MLGRGEGPRAAASRRWRLWVVPGGALLILGFLTAEVLAGGKVVAADWRVYELVRAHVGSPPWQRLDTPARLIANLGSWYVAMPLLAVMALALSARRREVRPVLVAATAVALLAVTVIPAKILIGRPGPGFTVVAPGGSGDFPSGHTATACVCYGVAFLLLSHEPLARGWRSGLAFMTTVGATIGAALVWSEYHWLSDVVAGWALSLIIVPVAFALAGEAVSARVRRFLGPVWRRVARRRT